MSLRGVLSLLSNLRRQRHRKQERPSSILERLGQLFVRRELLARRAAEAELDRFFSLSLDLLCISSADGYFKRVSPAVTDVLGWSVEEFLATPYLDFVHPDDLQATMREVERQVRRGEKVLRFENRYRHKDGSWRTLSWRSAPQPDGLMYATARDVTDLKRQEAELREAKEALEMRVQERTTQLAEANASLKAAYEELRQTQQAVMQQERLRVLGQMASGIAHDINNAISPVSLYTDLLLREPLTSRARGFLETIRRAIDDVAETVGRMREFYRQRETEVPHVPVQLNALIPQAVELTRARWADMPQQRGHVITLTTELAPALPPILGVASELREALTNLIFNAVDAMPQGGTLCLRTCLTGDEDRLPQVHLDVIDTGMGMSDETRRRCLELFFTTKGDRGTGLGLAMVYGIVQRHNGEIDITSSPGNGTRMRLSFAATRATAPIALAYAGVPPPGLRILVVDDDPIILESMRVVLEHAKCNVSIAAGGQEGIQAFAAALADGPPFELVITDLGMPSIDGHKVAGAVKALSPGTPVMMLTGWGQRMLSDGETPGNVDRVLGKPPKPSELLSAIGELAHGAAAPDANDDRRSSSAAGSAQ